MALSLNDLTMAEVEELENITGISLSEMADDSKPKAKFMTGLAWIAKRREAPEFTWGDARELTMSEVSVILGGDDPKGQTS